jgi:hypothetical protein
MTRHVAETVGWRYGMCPLETDADRFGPFRDLVALWQGRTGPDRPLPRRADFDMADFKGWLGRIFIAQVERDPFNLRFTLWGTQLVEWWRLDYTNKTLGSLSRDPAVWQSSEIQYFQRMDQAPFIGISSGKLSQHDRDHIKLMAVDLPLSDGTGMSHVLSAHMEIAMNDEIESLLPGCPVTILSSQKDSGTVTTI